VSLTAADLDLRGALGPGQEIEPLFRVLYRILHHIALLCSRLGHHVLAPRCVSLSLLREFFIGTLEPTKISRKKYAHFSHTAYPGGHERRRGELRYAIGGRGGQIPPKVFVGCSRCYCLRIVGLLYIKLSRCNTKLPPQNHKHLGRCQL
jgi:hypothetical protein